VQIDFSQPPAAKPVPFPNGWQHTARVLYIPDRASRKQEAIRCVTLGTEGECRVALGFKGCRGGGNVGWGRGWGCTYES
jgi:hypothetical protein